MDTTANGPHDDNEETVRNPETATAGAGADRGSGPDEDVPGGDPACWARLVCPECGSVMSEGHRTDCTTLTMGTQLPEKHATCMTRL